jgi:NADPH-dependent 2,4-dienoyl-CoA reductase/sulfur reductase-like enzyme
MKFLVIGGDASGMSAASRAKRRDPSIEVTVLEQTMDVSYSACGMPYNIADLQRPIDDLVVRQAEIFREKQGIDLLTGHRAEKIDREDKFVSGKTSDDASFEIPYDRLLIATGARPTIPVIPGLGEGIAKPLKSLDDGRKMKQFIKEKGVKNVVILGMGYIALEMCEALGALRIGVDMIKPRKEFIPWMDPELSSVVRKELEENGINLYPGQKIIKAEKLNNHVKIEAENITLTADMVLSATGIVPNSEIASDAGIELSVGGSISTNRRLKTSDDNIYAAGDCADAFHVVTGTKTWIPLALRANRAGWAVADNVCGAGVELEGVAGTAVFKVFDLEVARTGLSAEESSVEGFDPVSVTIKSRSRAHAHPGSSTIHVQMIGDQKTGRLLGAVMVGKEGCAHRINAAAVALHNKMTVKAFSQMDLSYAPPFGPVWDPLLTASNQLLKKL